MYTRHICVSANECITEISEENSGFPSMLGEFAEVCEAEGRQAVTLSGKKGRKYFKAGSYCGFVYFADGTLLEILPKAEDTTSARRILAAEFCRRCGFDLSKAVFDPEINFLEFFISVFSGETTKIIKSGVLSAYASREDNLTSVQGTIMFAENIRRNLVHKERVYVRHDVFTSDRAENRIIKASAKMLIKMTANSHSSRLLNEALAFLDEVNIRGNITAEFGKCVNARNTKKYSTVLSIGRMLFDKNEGTAFSSKYVTCAQLFNIEPQAEKE